MISYFLTDWVLIYNRQSFSLDRLSEATPRHLSCLLVCWCLRSAIACLELLYLVETLLVICQHHDQTGIEHFLFDGYQLRKEKENGDGKLLDIRKRILSILEKFKMVNQMVKVLLLILMEMNIKVN